MTEQLNGSFVKQEEEIIQSKKEEILQFFEQQGYKPNSVFDDQLWFLPEINKSYDHILWKIINDAIGYDYNKDDHFATETKIEAFVQRLLDEAQMIHTKVVDLKKNIDSYKDEIENFDKFLKIIEANKTEYNQENAFVISYVDENNQINEIAKFYSIKYKLGTALQNYQLLYPENSNRSTCISNDHSIESISLIVMGRRLENKIGDARTSGEDYKELAQIKIPIQDIYQQVRPRHFALPTIPQCYLTVNYQDQSLDASFCENVTINLRFDLRLSYLYRILIIKDQKQYRTQLIEANEDKFQQQLGLMQQLLSPFKQEPKLHYVPTKGIGLQSDFKDDNRENLQVLAEIKPPKERESCCLIC
ncbi:unnamed protein product (macronuclear) [Paramecium tetraurelia]|uniref:Uncharacterized protein n=1 Tax=Paramecium tetraurelia TaxID=5888 RepID=A0BPK4_PARTE|nr:uncharacterized protein GSPATT00005220001 [Paramecium tetraurelia]CAK60471.1 unnamed protein product [Paramecium tetraurelia]|eukprot:XP_001427869.1 hypothetical protein (macronuclear) [Paramecium tetraurelia strain d4-2]